MWYLIIWIILMVLGCIYSVYRKVDSQDYGALILIGLFSGIFYSSSLSAVKDDTKAKSNKVKLDSVWITAHDGKISKYNPQTSMNEVPFTDSVGEEFLLIKVFIKSKK